jgi:hypothetical protein
MPASDWRRTRRPQPYGRRLGALFPWVFGVWGAVGLDANLESALFGAALALAVSVPCATLGGIAEPWRFLDPRRLLVAIRPPRLGPDACRQREPVIGPANMALASSARKRHGRRPDADALGGRSRRRRHRDLRHRQTTISSTSTSDPVICSTTRSPSARKAPLSTGTPSTGPSRIASSGWGFSEYRLSDPLPRRACRRSPIYWQWSELLLVAATVSVAVGTAAVRFERSRPSGS